MRRYVLQHKEHIATAIGCLSKAWYTDTKTGQRMLVKGNSNFVNKNQRIFGYEPYSEVLSSIIARHLGIPHIYYELRSHSEFPEVETFNCDYVSVCREYLTFNQRVTAYNTMKAYFDKDILDFWTMYRRMPINPAELCQMLLFDAIIGNTDRHLNNWELEWLVINSRLMFRGTPLFDSGASLLALVPNSRLTLDFKLGTDISKPFKSTHVQQMKLVKRIYPEFKVHYNIDSLWNGIYCEIVPILKLLPEKRAKCIIQYLHNRLYYFLGEFM